MWRKGFRSLRNKTLGTSLLDSNCLDIWALVPKCLKGSSDLSVELLKIFLNIDLFFQSSLCSHSLKLNGVGLDVAKFFFGYKVINE